MGESKPEPTQANRDGIIDSAAKWLHEDAGSKHVFAGPHCQKICFVGARGFYDSVLASALATVRDAGSSEMEDELDSIRANIRRDYEMDVSVSKVLYDLRTEKERTKELREALESFKDGSGHFLGCPRRTDSLLELGSGFPSEQPCSDECQQASQALTGG